MMGQFMGAHQPVWGQVGVAQAAGLPIQRPWPVYLV